MKMKKARADLDCQYRKIRLDERLNEIAPWIQGAFSPMNSTIRRIRVQPENDPINIKVRMKCEHKIKIL